MLVFIPGISPINVYNWTGNLAQNNATAPNGRDASVNNPAYSGSSLGTQDTAAQIPTPAFTVPPVSPTLGALSPDQINLQAVVSLGVLQTNENLAQAMFGLTKPEPEALLSTPSDVQAVQPANATELNPGRSQYFFTAYFKMMNMPISGSAVDMTA